MANTKKLHYSLTSRKKLPIWLNRDWAIFENLRLRADYIKDINTVREAVRAGETTTVIEVLRIVKQYSLPLELSFLIQKVLSNENVDDEELLNAVPSPIYFLNYEAGEIHPSNNPSGDFWLKEHANTAFSEKNGEPYYKSKQCTYLVIPPNTTKSELKDFIDRHFEDAKHLIYQNTGFFESDKDVKGRITKPSIGSVIDERMRQLRSEGLKPREIKPIIESEFKIEIQSFDISKRLYQMKKRKNRQ